MDKRAYKCVVALCLCPHEPHSRNNRPLSVELRVDSWATIRRYRSLLIGMGGGRGRVDVDGSKPFRGAGAEEASPPVCGLYFWLVCINEKSHSGS
eukprot:scaffold6120_cov109-Isochrysis_galbana.AAC.3